MCHPNIEIATAISDIYIYSYMYVDKNILDRTLAIDSRFQTFEVGLLVKFID